jgi:hypothetical protein
MAMVGAVQNENDNMGVVFWQNAVDELKREAEVENCIILHHIGKADRERGRGASQIEAWPDALWYMEVEDDGARTFKSVGREVDLEPIALSYDKATEMYSWDGATRAGERVERILVSWLQALIAIHAASGEWPNSREARGHLRGDKNKGGELIKRAREQGLIRVEGQKPMRFVVTDVGLEYAGR